MRTIIAGLAGPSSYAVMMDMGGASSGGRVCKDENGWQDRSKSVLATASSSEFFYNRIQ